MSEAQGRVVIVTGAAAGIGRATALRFARAGARVSAWDLAPEPLARVAEEIRAAGGQAFPLQVDVTDPEAVETAVAATASHWSRIDVLVNNAGIVRDAQLVKWKDGAELSRMSEADFDAVISVNLRAVFLVTRAVVPRMIAAGSGVILSASSVVGFYGNFDQTNYAATKSGVIAMTRTWARELGRYNIRVNAVAPGFIDTGMVASIPAKVVKEMVAHTPLGRLGRPEDVAEAYFWLASDAAAFVHGTVLSVDGGLVIGT